jgi:hypothetical protein
LPALSRFGSLARRPLSEQLTQLNMKTLKSSFQRNRVQCFTGIAILIAFVLFCGSVGRSDPPFGLTIQVTNANQLYLRITNGLSTTNYEIYRRITLDPTNQWTPHLVGSNGQFNFLVNMGIDLFGFFEARLGNDADGDHVANSVDGNPYNSAVGALTITIDSPANGTNLQ